MRSFSLALGLAAGVVNAAPAILTPHGIAAAAAAAASPEASQVPFPDGFPNPNAAQLAAIEEGAFGTLSDAPPPPTLADDTITSVQLIAFAETIEAVFFDQLVDNITNLAPGFVLVPDRNFTLHTLQSIKNVEELHALNAQMALAHFGHDMIQAGKYAFPVATFEEAISFISRTTDFVQGVLGDVINKAGTAGDAGFTRGVAGALSNEGEQDGWFRFLLNLRPNQKPFNTISVREFAFSLLQDLVEPGTLNATNIGEINLPVFQGLSAPDPPAETVDLPFTFSLVPTRKVPSNNAVQQAGTARSANLKETLENDPSSLFITYLNGQDSPISEPLINSSISGNTATVFASFPFEQFEMFGLSVAALTMGSGFADQDAMVNATILAPALLETVEPNFGATAYTT